MIINRLIDVAGEYFVIIKTWRKLEQNKLKQMCNIFRAAKSFRDRSRSIARAPMGGKCFQYRPFHLKKHGMILLCQRLRSWSILQRTKIVLRKRPRRGSAACKTNMLKPDDC